MTDVICPVCKVEFETRPYRIKKNVVTKAVCCSHECANVLRKKIVGPRLSVRYYKGLVTSVCKLCKKEFTHRPCWPRDCCSASCARTYHWVKGLGPDSHPITNCFLCKKEFRIFRALLKKGGRRFCSQECQRSFWLQNQSLGEWTKGANKTEKLLLKELEKFGFKFLGDGRFRVGRLFPDFVNKKRKQIVELFGDYWHEKSEVKKRIRYFAKRGWECLIIWESELRKNPREVRARVTQFCADWYFAAA